MKISPQIYKLIRNRRRLLIVAGIAVLSATVSLFAWLAVTRDVEGIYLLKSRDGSSIVLADALFLGDESRLLYGLDFPGKNPLSGESAGEGVRLSIDWNAAQGHGYISNRLADGTTLVTHFSRYVDSLGNLTNGLFIGGGVPSTLLSKTPGHKNSSGMAWFDGQQWNHIWCNTNEGIGSTVSRSGYAPSQWTFLGSRIVESSPERVVLTSLHEVRIDGVPLRIARTVEAKAGQPWLNLKLTVLNSGLAPSSFFYYYGDEPWVGNFGSAAGDVGWSVRGLDYYEDEIDPQRDTYAGMYDAGNPLLGEGTNFRHVANFIDWGGGERPNTAFFANHYRGLNHDPSVRVPLSGDGRAIGMYWSRMLFPGQSLTVQLAIGKADIDPVTNLPQRPSIDYHNVTACLDPSCMRSE